MAALQNTVQLSDGNIMPTMSLGTYFGTLVSILSIYLFKMKKIDRTVSLTLYCNNFLMFVSSLVRVLLSTLL